LPASGGRVVADLLAARPRLMFGESRAMALSDQDREEDPPITKSDLELAAWLEEVNGQLEVLSLFLRSPLGPITRKVQ
jgi:hypothetical protein